MLGSGFTVQSFEFWVSYMGYSLFRVCGHQSLRLQVNGSNYAGQSEMGS